MNSFICGSHAYGIPSEKSDIDLVVLISRDDYRKLSSVEDFREEAHSAGPDSFPSLRFGKLNIICFESPELFEAWKEGTDFLIAEKPVTKDRAIEVLNYFRDTILKPDEPSSPPVHSKPKRVPRGKPLRLSSPKKS